MTLREELEILRGEPLEVFEDNPMDIPCIETSDNERLCKHPVVSVHMITYNHERYIRQAIEGVMMQNTDFEFELVIGEDCSQDKTREICFKYQKKYPEKIRVLWWHENVSKFGGNARRVTAHCRGKFIALCEGDDYWIDPLKLQKQVDAMRSYPNVGYCITGARIAMEMPSDHPRAAYYNKLERVQDGTFRFPMAGYKAGLVPRDVFWRNRNTFPRTATVLYRVSTYHEVQNQFEIFKWKLRVGDALLWHAFARVCDAYFLPGETAIYRLSMSGVCSSGENINYAVQIDFNIVRAYFLLDSGDVDKGMDSLRKLLISYRLEQKAIREGAYSLGCVLQFLNWRRIIHRKRGYWVLYILYKYMKIVAYDVRRRGRVFFRKHLSLNASRAFTS